MDTLVSQSCLWEYVSRHGGLFKESNVSWVEVASEVSSVNLRWKNWRPTVGWTSGPLPKLKPRRLAQRCM